MQKRLHIQTTETICHIPADVVQAGEYNRKHDNDYVQIIPNLGEKCIFFIKYDKFLLWFTLLFG